ncbi:MAG: sel1 repeat family protein [Verrucomicrobia bacterium]|jgi:hypothetical protein|nr:sel1 repeat family protein [Verrucomicrobiota bacterium]
MKHFYNSVFALVLLASCCEAASFRYQVQSEEKRLWIEIQVPAEQNAVTRTPGFLWTAKLRPFTKPPLWGTPLTNVQVRDLDWTQVRERAEAGNPSAAYLLAHKLMKSNAPYGNAAYWLSQAADKGYGAAENDLGVLSMFGLGVTRDMSRAVELFERSAAKGVAMGHFNIGICRLVGLGCRRNYGLAKSHIELAASKDLAVAEVILAVNHAAGTQIARRDIEDAYEFVLLARAHGSSWSLGDDNTRNWYYVGIDELEAYLEDFFPDAKLRRIQSRMSRLAQVSRPSQDTLASLVESYDSTSSGVVVLGPDAAPEEEAPEEAP